jgi:eukaryotic-like serine/threonine-protein kinase
MPEVTLPKGIWWYDDQDALGPPGGFGTVFRGRSPNGHPVAVKRLQSYQTREMRIADFLLGYGLAHVIPILFVSIAGTNFIVMPIATKSLQQHIDSSGPTRGIGNSRLNCIWFGGDRRHYSSRPQASERLVAR